MLKMIGYNYTTFISTPLSVSCQTISMLDVDSHKNYRDTYKVSTDNNAKLIQHEISEFMKTKVSKKKPLNLCPIFST